MPNPTPELPVNKEFFFKNKGIHLIFMRIRFRSEKKDISLRFTEFFNSEISTKFSLFAYFCAETQRL